MQLKHRILMAAALAAMTVSLGTAAFAAGTAYTTQPAPVPPGTPGGFKSVITVSSVSPKVIFPKSVAIKINGSPIHVYALPHSFRRPVQFVITDPNFKSIGGSLARLGYGRYKVVAGLGLSVVISGRSYGGNFLKPITIFALNKKIGPGDIVVGWNAQGKLFRVPTPLFRHGRAVWKLNHGAAFAVLVPKG